MRRLLFTLVIGSLFILAPGSAWAHAGPHAVRHPRHHAYAREARRAYHAYSAPRHRHLGPYRAYRPPARLPHHYGYGGCYAPLYRGTAVQIYGPHGSAFGIWW